MKAGNKRFLKHKMKNINYDKQIEQNKNDQHPHSLVLSCLDSRVPPEIILIKDLGIYLLQELLVMLKIQTFLVVWNLL